MRTAVIALSFAAIFLASCTIATPIPPQVVTADDPEPRSVMLSEMCAKMGWTYQYGPGAYQYRATGPRGDAMTFRIGSDLLTINDTKWRQERDAAEIKGKDLMIPESTFNFVVKHFGMHHLVRNSRKAPERAYELPAIAPAPSQVDTPKVVSNELRGLNICIDPGHGAHNIGGQAFGVQEKVIALNVSLLLRDLCEAAGAKVVMTRTTDVFVELDERCDIANRAKCDLFLSIHANIAPGNNEVQGFEAFHHPDSRGGENFARRLIKAYDTITDSPNRGAKERVLRVVDKTRMPAVLFELGFLSNKEEGQRLAGKDYQKAMAKALYDGILDTWANKPTVSR